MSDGPFRVKNGIIVNTSLLFANNGKVGINTSTPNTSLHIASNDAILIPRGNTAERPVTGANGMFRYNTDTGALEAYTSGNWNGVTADTTNVVSIGLSYDSGSDTISIDANNFMGGALLSSFGNSTANIQISNTGIKVANSTGNANLQPTQLVIGVSTVNSTVVAVGANIIANTTAIAVGANVLVNSTSFMAGANVTLDVNKLAVGNSTANLIANSILISSANSTGISNIQPGIISVGSSIVNTAAISSPLGIFSTGWTSGNSTVNVVSNSTQISIGANVSFTTVRAFFGNSTVNLSTNSVLLSLQNASGIANLDPLKLVIGVAQVNATALVAGSNVFLDTTKLSIGNTTANLIANSILISLANSTSIANIDPLKVSIGTSVLNSTALGLGANIVLDTIRLSLGNTTQNCVVNSLGIYVNGAVLSIAAAGANTQIPFNDSGVYGASAGHTFDKTTNTVFLSNTLTVGANVTLNTVKFFVGNTTANLTANSILISLANSTSTMNIQPLQLLVGVSIVNSTALQSGLVVVTTGLTVGNSTVNVISNSTQLSIGSNVFINTVKASFGNSTANLSTNSVLISLANATSIANLDPLKLAIGGSVVNASATAHGANVLLDTIHLAIGNTTANASLNSVFFSVANSTASANMDPGKLLVGSSQVNTTAISVGANLSLNTSALLIGNSTANSVINSTALIMGPCTLMTMNQTLAVTTLPNTQIIDSFPIASYLSAKYTLTLKDNNTSNNQISDVLVVQGDGAQTGFIEIGMISNSAANLGSFTVTANATHAILNFIMASNNITFKGTRLYTG
jgi:hypothetical protein